MTKLSIKSKTDSVKQGGEKQKRKAEAYIKSGSIKSKTDSVKQCGEKQKRKAEAFKKNE